MTVLQPGDVVQVRALHSDGYAYRWWQTTIESVHDDHIVTFSPAGHVIGGAEGGWVSKYPCRYC